MFDCKAVRLIPVPIFAVRPRLTLEVAVRSVAIRSNTPFLRVQV